VELLVIFKNKIKKNKNKNKIFIIDTIKSTNIAAYLLKIVIWVKKLMEVNEFRYEQTTCKIELQRISDSDNAPVEVSFIIGNISWLEYETTDRVSIPVLNIGWDVFNCKLLKNSNKNWYTGKSSRPRIVLLNPRQFISNQGITNINLSIFF
jgi:hypothetical protein